VICIPPVVWCNLETRLSHMIAIAVNPENYTGERNMPDDDDIVDEASRWDLAQCTASEITHLVPEQPRQPASRFVISGWRRYLARVTSFLSKIFRYHPLLYSKTQRFWFGSRISREITDAMDLYLSPSPLSLSLSLSLSKIETPHHVPTQLNGMFP